MLISSICFAIVNLCVKYLDHLPVSELVLFRSVISISICFYFIRKLKLPLFGNNKRWLLGRGIFGASALTMFFYTIKGINLASATTIQYLSPVFTVIIAMVLLKEKVKPLQWLLFLIAFSGIFLIKGFDSSDSKELYVFLGVGSAVLSGVAYNCIVKCRYTDHPITIVMYFPLVAIPVMAVWSSMTWVTPNLQDIPLLIIIGILTQVAQVSMTKALHSGDTGRIMPIKYIGAIWAILIGYFVFDESLKPLTYAGIALVLSGVVLNTLYTSWLNKKAQAR